VPKRAGKRTRTNATGLSVPSCTAASPDIISYITHGTLHNARSLLTAVFHFIRVPCFIWMDLDVPPSASFSFSFFRNCLTETLTLTLDLGHRVRTKWEEGPNLTPTHFTANFTAMRFLRYNSPGLHFQESRVVLNDSSFKNGWGIVFSKSFRHKQGSN